MTTRQKLTSATAQLEITNETYLPLGIILGNEGNATCETYVETELTPIVYNLANNSDFSMENGSVCGATRIGNIVTLSGFCGWDAKGAKIVDDDPIGVRFQGNAIETLPYTRICQINGATGISTNQNSSVGEFLIPANEGYFEFWSTRWQFGQREQLTYADFGDIGSFFFQGTFLVGTGISSIDPV